MRTIAPDGAGKMRACRARKPALFLVCSILLGLVIVPGGVPSSQAATLLDNLLGSWAGSGQIRYDDSSSEGIRCNAYYTGSAERLHLAIRCRSDSTEVEIRGILTRKGDALSGTWEERTFHASGEATGRITGDKLNLSISGGGFSGSMGVAYAGTKQTVTIATQGIKMRSVNVTMSKS
jgi:hypothetical protein